MSDFNMSVPIFKTKQEAKAFLKDDVPLGYKKYIVLAQLPQDSGFIQHKFYNNKKGKYYLPGWGKNSTDVINIRGGKITKILGVEEIRNKLGKVV